MCKVPYTVLTMAEVPPHIGQKCGVCGKGDQWVLHRTPLSTHKNRTNLWVCGECRRHADDAALRSLKGSYNSGTLTALKDLVATGCCVECGSTFLVPGTTRANPPRAVVDCPSCGAVYMGNTLLRLMRLYCKIIESAVYKKSIPCNDSEQEYHWVLLSAPIRKNVEVFRHLSLLIGWMDVEPHTQQDRVLVRQPDVLSRIFPGVSRLDLQELTTEYHTHIQSILISD